LGSTAIVYEVGEDAEVIGALSSRPSGVEATVRAEAVPGVGLSDAPLDGLALGLVDGLAVEPPLGSGLGVWLGLTPGVGLVSEDGLELGARLLLVFPAAAGAAAAGDTVGVDVEVGVGDGAGKFDESSVVPSNVTFPADWVTDVALKPGSRSAILYGPTDSWASLVDGSAVETRTCLSLAFSPRSQPEPIDAATRDVSIGCQLPAASL
jgi:hypothetical protein